MKKADTGVQNGLCNLFPHMEVFGTLLLDLKTSTWKDHCILPLTFILCYGSLLFQY